MIVLMTLFVFLTVFFLGKYLASLFEKSDDNLSQRVSKLLQDYDKNGKLRPKLERRERLSDLPFFDQILRSIQGVQNIHIWVRQSGLLMSTGALFLTSAFMALIVSLWSAFFKFPIVLAMIVTLMGGAIPFLYVQNRRQYRRKLFSRGFPDAIARLANSLRAGYSLQMAIEAMIQEADSLIAGEFRLVLAEMEVGQSFEVALQKMIERVDTPDLRLFIASVTIQRESGGNLAEILDNLELTIRDRFALQKELEAATAQAKLSGLVLSLLPIFAGIFIFFIHREYILFFFQDPMGKNLFWCAMIGQVMGMLTIKKIVSIQM